MAFAAVHDSFWTHPCDVDGKFTPVVKGRNKAHLNRLLNFYSEMNMVLREVFVDLYQKPLLAEVKESWEMRYPDVEFPEIPPTGDLDLNEVTKAPYFFQ